ncbi:MAG: nucleoside triphosphate pyrophosphohydrolase [Chloroflexota bacterium]
MFSPDELRGFATLVAIFARLRAEGGCPWDREQTHRSLRSNLLEETYEVLEALDEGDSKKLREELGDLLMQIVFHARIAEEDGEFELGDVIEGINKKLIYRHPHVFGKTRVKDAGEVVHNWEELKHRAKGEKSSILSGVPKEMPSLAYGEAIQRRAATAGFDWKEAQDIVDKLVEEVKELQSAKGKKRQSEEFGDLLFTLVNIARRMGIDPETALRETNRKFYRRFTRMEELARERGKDFSKLSLEEQDRLWEEAKGEET